MNRNYRNIDKRIWTDKYVHEHHTYDKNNVGYLLDICWITLDSSGVTVS